MHEPLGLAIQAGVPLRWAVTLDSTNFAAASWNNYTGSNITANLGANQGWHTVWVGLSPLPSGAVPTWNAVCLDLDLTPPVLVVTNAIHLAVPVLQLQGYANEELASLTFDLNNANGAISNQAGFMTKTIFNTKGLRFEHLQFYD